jgi:hypothetical protein
LVTSVPGFPRQSIKLQRTQTARDGRKKADHGRRRTPAYNTVPVDAPDDFFSELRQHFSEREIVELTAHITHENYNAKMNSPAPL